MTKPTSPDDNKQVANRAMVQAAVLAAVVLLCIVAWLAFDFLLLPVSYTHLTLPTTPYV